MSVRPNCSSRYTTDRIVGKNNEIAIERISALSCQVLDEDWMHRHSSTFIRSTQLSPWRENNISGAALLMDVEHDVPMDIEEPMIDEVLISQR